MQQIKKENPELEDIENFLLALGPKIGLAAISGNKKLIEEYKLKVEQLAAKKQAILKNYPDCNLEVSCKSCKDTGFINGKYCTCVLEKAKQIAKQEFINENFCQEYSFSNFDLSYYPQEYKNGVKKIFDFVKSYAQNFNANSGNLLLLGNTGLGKTHLSLSIANVVIEKGVGVLYGPADTLFRRAEKEYFSFSASTQEMDNLLNTDLLIIDDLGTEFKTKYTQSIVYNIINTRILKKKPTIISTNLDIDELESIYTPRIVSRIIGNYTVKELKGNDIRQLKFKN